MNFQFAVFWNVVIFVEKPMIFKSNHLFCIIKRSNTFDKYSSIDPSDTRKTHFQRICLFFNLRMNFLFHFDNCIKQKLPSSFVPDQFVILNQISDFECHYGKRKKKLRGFSNKKCSDKWRRSLASFRYFTRNRSKTLTVDLLMIWTRFCSGHSTVFEISVDTNRFHLVIYPSKMHHFECIRYVRERNKLCCI